MAATSQRKESFEDYTGFVDKFTQKLTTDDCYTPPAVYEIVKKWVDKNILPLEGVHIVRPFYPGGDYKKEIYPPKCVVLDNPPFSIYSEICRYYQSIGVKFFLFAPELTAIRQIQGLTFVLTGCEITYHNGAKIPTGFATNMLNGDQRIICAGDLSRELQALTPTKKKKRYSYPANVTSGAMLRRIASAGRSLSIAAKDCVITSGLKNGGGFGSSIFLSKKAAAAIAAEQAAAVRTTHPIILAESEEEILKQLG